MKCQAPINEVCLKIGFENISTKNLKYLFKINIKLETVDTSFSGRTI